MVKSQYAIWVRIGQRDTKCPPAPAESSEDHKLRHVGNSFAEARMLVLSALTGQSVGEYLNKKGRVWRDSASGLQSLEKATVI